MSIKNNANLIMEMNGTINRFSYLFSHTRALIALFSLIFFHKPNAFDVSSSDNFISFVAAS